jgi:hypothetical protein
MLLLCSFQLPSSTQTRRRCFAFAGKFEAFAPVTFPCVPGFEGVAEVVESATFKKGQRVVGKPWAPGTWQTYFVMPDENLVRLLLPVNLGLWRILTVALFARWRFITCPAGLILEESYFVRFKRIEPASRSLSNTKCQSSESRLCRSQCRMM